MNISRRAALSILVAGAMVSAVGGCATARVVIEPVYYPSEPAQARVVRLKSFDDLAELVPAELTFVELVRGGRLGTRAGAPAGIHYFDGRLLVCDTEKRAVHEWDLSTGRGRIFGRTRSGSLVTPVDVAVDAQGRIYVADTGLSAVIVFDESGEVARRLKPEKAETYRPTAVAVRDSTVYVTDAVAHRVNLYSTADGSPAGTIGEVGSGPGQLYFPTGVAVGSDGAVVVSDMMNGRIQVFERDGVLRTAFGSPGDRYGDLGMAKHTDVGPDETVIVADAAFGRVHLFDGRGRLLILVGEDDQARVPLGIAVARELPDRIVRLVPEGFEPSYYFFVSHPVGEGRIDLYAVGKSR